MHYLGDSGTARVENNFKIVGKNLDAIAQTGFYSDSTEKARVYGNATANYNLSTIKGNDIWIYFSHQQAESFTVVGGVPTGITRDTIRSDSTLDTTTNILTGDSLHFTLDTTRIERIVSVGNGKMEQYSLDNKNESDLLFGDRIESNIHSDGTGDAIAYKRARSIYRSDSDIHNEVSSDSLFLYFDKKGVTEINLTGGVQGVILPQDNRE
jgi:hypothetical protein